jgi:uncharacterized damage-inducible protein DinB
MEANEAKEQLIEAWRTNNRLNLLLIDLASDEGLQKTLSPKGRTIYQQLAHVHNTRLGWIEVAAKEIHDQYHQVPQDAPPDKATLRKAFESSGHAVENLIELNRNKGRVTGFRKGLIPFVSYLIAHDAHHRGNALLTLKQTGIKVPDQLKWGLWEWNK